jgi:hypothetical protein
MIELLRIGIFVFLFLPFFLTAQQKKTIYFDQNWQPAKSPTQQVYYCEYTTIENDWIHGPFLCFYLKNEELVKQYYFEYNKLNGQVFEYYHNGNIKLEAAYMNGLPMGEWKEWDAKGELVVYKTFDESNRMMRDYFKDEDYNYRMVMGLDSKKEEPPIFSTECLLKKREEEKYRCSDMAMLDYYSNPPIPPNYNYQSKVMATKLKYELNHDAVITDVVIVESSGDGFLDELAKTHILNMIPFEAAKTYGTPISVWLEADVVFKF